MNYHSYQTRGPGPLLKPHTYMGHPKPEHPEADHACRIGHMQTGRLGGKLPYLLDSGQQTGVRFQTNCKQYVDTHPYLRRMKLLTRADSSVERSSPSCVTSGAAPGSRPVHTDHTHSHILTFYTQPHVVDHVYTQ